MKKQLLSIAILFSTLTPVAQAELSPTDIVLKYADKGDPEAQFVLGNMYAEGKGVPQNDEDALTAYENAANGGYAQAQYRLGMINLEGKQGLVEDAEEAFQWFMMAAKQEHRVAEFYVGNMMFKGQGVDTDRKAGMEWMFRAADHNCKRAKVRLAQIYDRGIGIPEDNATAVEWYIKAAEHELSYAQRALGRMYRSGEGVKADVTEAVKWYRLAAEHKKARAKSKAKAQFILGEIFLNGEGNVAADREEAMRWLSMSAEAGSKEAKALLAKVGG